MKGVRIGEVCELIFARTLNIRWAIMRRAEQVSNGVHDPAENIVFPNLPTSQEARDDSNVLHAAQRPCTELSIRKHATKYKIN